jgi:hypothetical protein
LLLASFVLVFILNLFRYCLLSFSSFSFSFSFSFSWSLSSSVSFSFSVRSWISSMKNKRCLWIHFIWHHRLHLNAFELRKCSQCWIFERLFFCNKLHHFRINIMIHLHLHLRILRILRRSSSIFRFRKTIAWFYHLWFLYVEKKFDDWRNDFIKFERTFSLIRVKIINWKI